ncbi:MAG: ferritin family protein [Candidatus Odinarchaeota archaeon]
MFNERIEFYKKQILFENEIVRFAENAVKGIRGDRAVRELILGIALDSKKHAQLLKAIIDILTTPSEPLTEVELEELKHNIKQHIELEKKAIDSYKEILKSPMEGAEKLIIEVLAEDEVRHHALLQKIYQEIIKQRSE